MKNVTDELPGKIFKQNKLERSFLYMSKRKLRCPHCGCKGYILSDLWGTTYKYFYERERQYARCFICGKYCNVDRNNKKTGKVIYYGIVLAVVIVMLMLIINENLFINTIWLIIPAVILIITLTISFTLNLYYKYFIPLEDVGTRHTTIINNHPNTRVQINNSKRIRHMWVYGLKFSTETKNIKFKERFTDGLVPAQFYPAEDGSNEFEIRIIGKEFVPDEILFEGAEFLVEDIDGLFICKGKVTKTELDY